MALGISQLRTLRFRRCVHALVCKHRQLILLRVHACVCDTELGDREHLGLAAKGMLCSERNLICCVCRYIEDTEGEWEIFRNG